MLTLLAIAWTLSGIIGGIVYHLGYADFKLCHVFHAFLLGAILGPLLLIAAFTDRMGNKYADKTIFRKID